MFSPSHVVFIVVIFLILFGPGKLPKLGEGFARSMSDLMGLPSASRSRLFMAKGVDPSIGRDVGDMLPDHPAKPYESLYLCLIALVVGSTVYLLLLPLLPIAARIDAHPTNGWPVLVDTWICVLVFGILKALRLAHQQKKPKRLP